MAALISDSGAGKGNGAAGRRHGLQAEQLKERAEEHIDARTEQIRAKKAIAVRAVRLREVLEECHKLFQQQLKLSGLIFESRDHKDPRQRRQHQQHARDDKPGNDRRIHVHQPEQTDFIVLMQNRVPHDRLQGFLRAALAQQQAERQRGKQQNAEDRKRNDLTLLAHMHPPLIRPAAAQASCSAARKLKK